MKKVVILLLALMSLGSGTVVMAEQHPCCWLEDEMEIAWASGDVLTYAYAVSEMRALGCFN